MADGSVIETEKVEFVHAVNVTSDDRIANIRANAHWHKTLPTLRFKSIAVCASGPSLADHLPDIRARQKAGWSVAAMNGSHNFLIRNGITPDYMFMIDARPVNLPFLDEANDQTTYVISTQTHPEVLEALKGRKVLLWPVFHDTNGLMACQKAMEANPGPVFSGSLNVAQSCLNALLALGYRTWHLFGCDGSMRGDSKHAFPQPQNDGEQVEEFFWPVAPDGSHLEGVSRKYLATPTMAHAAQFFPERVSHFRKLGIEVELYGQGLIPDMVAALSSRDGLVTVPRLEDAIPVVPAPKPRKRAVERLPIVTFKWQGHIPYFAEDVNVWASMVSRNLRMDHELVCVTDDSRGIDGGIRIIPLWRDQFEHGRDWHRVKLFAEEMADTIGPRFVCMDLDTVICRPLDPLFDHDAPFMAWRDPNRDQYCTALFMMDAGAYPHVWEDFNAEFAMRLRLSGIFGGYDQAWISYALPGMPRWTPDDGVLSFRKDILAGHEIENAPESAKTLPRGARVINFHGKYNPRDEAVKAVLPWVSEFYR